MKERICVGRELMEGTRVGMEVEGFSVEGTRVGMEVEGVVGAFART